MNSALPGERFGRLVVTEVVDGKTRKCRCDCGNETIVRRDNLKSGNTLSCGCLRREVEKIAAVTHGASGKGKWTKAYSVWHGMKQRCFNPRNSHWESYGGRGITVSDTWKNSFQTFLADMGEPEEGQSLDRIDNNGPYSKENCRWTTRTNQARNKTCNRVITYRGQTKSLAEWAEELSIPYFTLYSRLKRGWDVEEAFYVEARNV